jgi:hypothetical protein
MNKFNLFNREAVAYNSGAMEQRPFKNNGRKSKSHTSRRKNLRRIFMLFAVLFVSISSIFAQDVITKRNGDKINAIVTDIGIDEVKYKNPDNPNGPNYTLKKSGIAKIEYANGSVDEFEIEDTVIKVKEYTSKLTDKYPDKGKWYPELKNLRNYEKYMEDEGFKSRIVMRDFSTDGGIIFSTVFWWSPGIWINYQKQLVALREVNDVKLGADLFNPDYSKIIIIPFNKIRAVGKPFVNKSSRGIDYVYITITADDGDYTITFFDARRAIGGTFQNIIDSSVRCANQIETVVNSIVESNK